MVGCQNPAVGFVPVDYLSLLECQRWKHVRLRLLGEKVSLTGHLVLQLSYSEQQVDMVKPNKNKTIIHNNNIILNF